MLRKGRRSRWPSGDSCTSRWRKVARVEAEKVQSELQPWQISLLSDGL